MQLGQLRLMILTISALTIDIIFFNIFSLKYLHNKKFALLLQSLNGTIAQSVEHRTENPGVPSSTLGGTTASTKVEAFFLQR